MKYIKMFIKKLPQTRTRNHNQTLLTRLVHLIFQVDPEEGQRPPDRVRPQTRGHRRVHLHRREPGRPGRGQGPPRRRHPPQGAGVVQQDDGGRAGGGEDRVQGVGGSPAGDHLEEVEQEVSVNVWFCLKMSIGASKKYVRCLSNVHVYYKIDLLNN